jgi:hypothetical protein
VILNEEEFMILDELGSNVNMILGSHAKHSECSMRRGQFWCYCVAGNITEVPGIATMIRVCHAEPQRSTSRS